MISSAHEVAGRVDPRAAAMARSSSRGYCSASAVHELGEADEPEVVDRHDRPRARRRADVVGGVHDVDRAGPALDARMLGAQPRLAREAVPGCGAVAARTPAGTTSREVVAAAPGERVRDDLEVGAASRARRRARRRPRRSRCGARAAACRRAPDGSSAQRRADQISSGSCSMASTRRLRLAGTLLRSCTQQEDRHHQRGGAHPAR